MNRLTGVYNHCIIVILNDCVFSFFLDRMVDADVDPSVCDTPAAVYM